jgi:YfiH family protein
LTWLECRAFRRLPWLLHAFSTRQGGVSEAPLAGLNLGFIEADRRANVEENRRRFFRQLGADSFVLASVRQSHSSHVYQVVRGASGNVDFRPFGYPAPLRPTARLPVGDALVTDQPGMLLSVRSADCLPILLVDPGRPAVAAVHAGWRGGLQRIVEKAVGVMRAVFGSDPRRIRAAIGPGIRACCYQVGEAVVAAYCGRFARGEQFFLPITKTGTASAPARHHPLLFLSPDPPGHGSGGPAAARLDLVAVAREQLHSAGLRPSNVQVADFCTACRTDLFFSHRREGSSTGRTMAVIGIRPERVR